MTRLPRHSSSQSPLALALSAPGFALATGLLLFLSPLPALASSPDGLDPTFSRDGYARQDVGFSSEASSVLVDRRGSYIVSGCTGAATATEPSDFPRPFLAR